MKIADVPRQDFQNENRRRSLPPLEKRKKKKGPAPKRWERGPKKEEKKKSSTKEKEKKEIQNISEGYNCVAVITPVLSTKYLKRYI